MIRWCAYCQKFLGEMPPIENKTFTHGICKDCFKFGLTVSAERSDRMKYLVELNSRFWQAGAAEDHAMMAQLADEGIREGIRPIDILFGFAGPMLFMVGDMWAQKKIDHEQEAKFTRTVETLVDLISRRAQLTATGSAGNKSKVLLANVFGNDHILGLQFAQIGISSLGICATLAIPTPTAAELVARVIAEKYEIVGLSIALPCQIESLEKTLAAFAAAPAFTGKIVVGGAAVTQQMLELNQRPRVRFLTSPSFSEQEKVYWLAEA